MPTIFEVDGIQALLEYDPDHDHFYGVAELGPGPDARGRPLVSRRMTFFGRDPDQLRELFRKGRGDLVGGQQP